MGQKNIVIDLTAQRLVAIENGKVYLSTKVSTGRYTHKTPTGEFNILAKYREHKSSEYPIKENGDKGGASMPFSLRLTNDGVMIHEGYIPVNKEGISIPDSHGCIRTPRGVAEKLFNWSKRGISVKIKGKTKYIDYSNRLLISNQNQLSSAEEIERFEDEFHEWGNAYYRDVSNLVYEEGSLDYLEDL